MESALYGVYTLVVLYQKSHSVASLTRSISDTPQLVCKHRTHTLSMKYSIFIEPMTSKWRQKCSPPQIIEPLTEKTWGQGCVIFGERKNKERNSKTPLRRRKYFEWIIKQLLNSEITHKLWLQTWQNNASCKTLINDLTFRMPQHTSSEVTVG